MPTQIQLRRGTYAQHQSFTGANAEPTFDTTNRVMRLHDGTNPGGLEIVNGSTLYKSNPVRAVATSNITLAGTQTIDGVALSVGDRVLVVGQTDQSKNGIYTVVDLPGVWARSFDFDKILNIQKGMVVYVAEGNTHNETIWKLTSQPTTLELHAITFEKWLGVETRGLAQNTVSGLVTRTTKGNYTSRAITVSGQGISVTNGDGISGNPLVSLNSTPNNTASTIMARDSSGNFTAQTATLNGSLNVDTGTIATTSTTATLLNTGATTVNAFGAATSISIGAATGTLTINNANTVITGNLTVNGTTEYLNSTTVQIADKNIELGKVTTPSDATADGGGITLKGAADKSIIWDSANTNWTSSEHWNLASGKTFKINNVPVLTSTTVLNDATQTSIAIGGSATTVTLGANGGTLTVGNPTIVGTQATQTLWNTVATTVNAFGAASSLNVGHSVTGAQTVNLATGVTLSGNTKTVNVATGGATGSTTNVNVGSTAGGTLTINNPAITVNGGQMTFTNTTDSTLSSNGSVIFAGGIGVAKNIVCDGTFSIFGDISVNGGDILTNQTNVTVFNTTATTANIFGAASTLNMGANSGILTIGNPTVVGTQATQNLYNTVATTLNIGGAATSINLGNATGATVTVRPGTVVGVNTTQSLYDTVATTVNAFGAATTLTLGNATGATVTVRPGTVVGANAVQNLWNTVATTINLGGAATSLSIGAATGTTTINNASTIISGNLAVNGGTLSTNQTTFNLVNGTSTTVNFAGAATAVNIGASTGNTTVNNNLVVSGNLTVNGTTTTVNATTLQVADLNIEVAKNAATAAAANGGGLTVVGANATLTYASAGDNWAMNKSLSITGTLSSSSNATVGGTLGVTGATTLSSTLGVTGATTLSSTLGVTGNTTIGGTLGVTGATTLAGLSATTGSFSSTLGVTGATTLSSTLGVTGAVTLSSTLSAGATTLSSLTLSSALSISSGGTGATTAQGARTNLLPSQSAGQSGYVLTTNGTDVQWSYLGNAMVTTFNGRANAVTLTSGDVTTALGYTPSTYYSKYLQGADAYTNGSDGWFRSNGQAGWYSATYAVGIYATQSGWVQTYGSAGMLANQFQQVSDVRLKDNITDSKYGLEAVLQLRSVEYVMKSSGKQEVGLIAQEVEKVLPEFVHTSPDEDGTKSVNYAQMVSVLIKAVQELKAEVDDLRSQLGK